MVPLESRGSAADAAAPRSTAAAAGPAPMPAAAAAAAPSPVACRNRRRLRPGANRRPGCCDPVAPCACSRGSSELVIGVLILLIHVVFLTASTQPAFGNGRTCCDKFAPSHRCLVWAQQTARG